MITLKKILSLLSLLALVASVAEATKASGATPELRLTMRSEVSVQAQTITLGTLAALTGPQELVAQLLQLEIAKAPRPSRSRRISTSQITAKVRRYTKTPFEIIADQNYVTVTTTSRTVTAATIADAVLGAFYDQLAAQPDISAAPVIKSRIKSILIPDVDYELAVELNFAPQSSTNRVQVSILDANTRERLAHLNLAITGHFRQKVPVLNRTITRGTTLTSTDIRTEYRPLRGKLNSITDASHYIGAKATSTIRAGQALQPHQVFRPPLVARGSKVRIVARLAGVEIWSTGIATEDGNKNRFINVSRNQQTILAQVTGAHTVEVPMY